MRTLADDDILDAIKVLVQLKDSHGPADDIDHLGNRRVRLVGELVENQYRIGLVRMERAIKERMSIQEVATLMPHDLINPKPVAAVLKGKVDVKGKNVVCLLSGGNIDVSFIQCIIEQGLVARSRRLRFTVTLLDRPGSLGKLLNDIAALGANILSVEHDRLTAGLNPNEIDVHVSCEVGDKAHGDRVRGQLIQSGYHVKID